MRHLYLAIWLAAVSPLAIEPAHAQSSQPEREAIEQSVTAFERALATTSAVVQGIKITLSSVEYDRGETLGMDLNLREVVGCTPLDCQAKERPYSFKDSRSISLFATLAPVDPSDARLGNWRMGATWVFHDETSLFRKEARDRLVGIVDRYHDLIDKKNIGEQHRQLWERLKDSAENLLTVTFNNKCAPGIPEFVQDEWDTENPELTPLLQAAAVACGAADRDQIARARQTLVDRELQELGEWSKTLKCGQEKVSLLRFQVLASEGDLWSETWNMLCEPVRQEIHRELAADIEVTKRELGSGLIVSFQGAGGSSAELLAPMEDGDAPTIEREYQLEGAVQVSHRWLRKSLSVDATAKVTHIVPFDDRGSTLSYIAALNLELGPGRINGSSVIVGVDAGADGVLSGDAERSYFMQGRIALPLHEQVFLLFSLHAEKGDGSAWTRTPSFALSWSYDQAGKRLARQISFLKK